MALGTPVVATDCPSGPREILADGRYGPLVPVGDWEALATAMRQVLDKPPDSDSLREAVREYAVETSASHYLDILGVTQDRSDAAVD
jgi:glycosyltransferase involved in cell wall biosynthesis